VIARKKEGDREMHKGRREGAMLKKKHTRRSGRAEVLKITENETPDPDLPSGGKKASAGPAQKEGSEGKTGDSETAFGKL